MDVYWKQMNNKDYIYICNGGKHGIHGIPIIVIREIRVLDFIADNKKIYNHVWNGYTNWNMICIGKGEKQENEWCQ